MSDSITCPDRGDVGWLSLNPQAGHEQRGRRPVICLSSKKYNLKSGLAIFCPITSKVKGYPFEVPLETSGDKVMGVVLSDQVKSLDWRQRKFEYADEVSEETLGGVCNLAVMLITN
ncbi:MAG: type II toxin-antitoxin system PemK/MazF family toxin [Verrucomicrobiota bacterium]